MTKHENDDILLSQLVDGELDSDRVNRVLSDVLDDADARQRLKQIIQLRRAFEPLRRQEPPRPIAVTSVSSHQRDPQTVPWRLGTLGMAAAIGGLLVMAGFWMAGYSGRSERTRVESPQAISALATVEQRHELAQAFAFHESVTGPLSWYAADDRNVRVAALRNGKVAGQPIAIFLRASTGAKDRPASCRTYMIVCRDRTPATIELSGIRDELGVTLRLLPVARGNAVQVTYAVVTSEEAVSRGVVASFSGQQEIGLSPCVLGQLPLSNDLLKVEASAWIMQDEIK